MQFVYVHTPSTLPFLCVATALPNAPIKVATYKGALVSAEYQGVVTAGVLQDVLALSTLCRPHPTAHNQGQAHAPGLACKGP